MSFSIVVARVKVGASKLKLTVHGRRSFIPTAAGSSRIKLGPQVLKFLKQAMERKGLLSLLETLKALEKQHSEFQLHCTLHNSKLQSKINELEEVEQNTKEGKLSNSLDHSLSDSSERLDSVKKELASMLRVIMSLKRSLDSVPSQAELIQYELRLISELNTHIQGKHCQTQKYYATFNTLLEIKELMLKETSLLNSISSQFQNAITSPAGRETQNISKKRKKVDLQFIFFQLLASTLQLTTPKGAFYIA
nr:coiled-coil domain-containing protein 93 isoform X1 [Ipomoea batatas]